MAGVLDALVSYVTGMLTEMAREEVAMLVGFSGDIDNLNVKLRDLKNFIADADRRNITDESVRGWVEELKSAMYDVTDIIDLCQLKVMEQDPSEDNGCLNPLLFCMRNPLHARDIGIRIKALNKKLDGISIRGRSFNFVKIEGYQDLRTTRPPAAERKTDPLLERSGVVGEKIEEDTRVLVDMLTKEAVDESDSIMVVAIVGVGGIGKTTLAKNIFNSEAIQGNFVKKIWLSITQEFTEVELLRTAIAAADGDLPKLGGGAGDKAMLVPALADAIRDKKFILVLDDMWGNSEWNNLLKAPFSHGTPRSRVLITTRHEKIARGMKAIYPYHHVEKLGSKDAWSLLKKQVLANEKSGEVDMLEDIGSQIIEKCDGLPLSVKVMGGLLCQKEKEHHAWEKVLNDAIWSESQMPEELNYAIYLSYENMTPGLKQCFLHFSLKPKKTLFPAKSFIGMWIGEGFILGNTDRLVQIGIEYYKELVSRNLIEPDTSYANQYECNMHDIVRSFAQFMTKGEALVAHKGETIKSKLSSKMFLRLSIETEGVESDEFEWRSLQRQKSLRSLILTGNFKIQPSDSLITVPSLRALHIEKANFNTLVESLYQLKHLRYLTLKNCNDIESLPENIYKMKFLIYISLEDCQNLTKLPDSIVKLQELKCLDIEGTSVSIMPRGFRMLTNLTALYGFQANMDGEWCSLEELGPLSQLVELGLKGLENVPDSSSAAKARLGAKRHLKTVILKCGSRLGDDRSVKEGVFQEEEQRIEEVFNELCPPPYLGELYIFGYFGRQLPIWMMSTTTVLLNSLRIIQLDDLACCTKLPDGLCQLPCLEFLQVHHRAPAIKHVGPEFMQPYNHLHHASSQASAAFPRVRNMRFANMVEWEEWEWEEEVQAMPALQELFIRSCKLRCIPPGLAFHANALKSLTLHRVQRLRSLGNFAFVVELYLGDNPDLTSISKFPKLQKLEIDRCPNLELLQDMAALRRLVVALLYSEKQLPLYLQSVNPSHLMLDCSLEILASMAAGKSGSDWYNFSHIQRLEAYAKDGDVEKKWYVLYTREPYIMETNIHGAESSGSTR